MYKSFDKGIIPMLNNAGSIIDNEVNTNAKLLFTPSSNSLPENKIVQLFERDGFFSYRSTQTSNSFPFES